jgi:hypothetical protein
MDVKSMYTIPKTKISALSTTNCLKRLGHCICGEVNPLKKPKTEIAKRGKIKIELKPVLKAA